MDPCFPLAREAGVNGRGAGKYDGRERESWPFKVECAQACGAIHCSVTRRAE